MMRKSLSVGGLAKWDLYFEEALYMKVDSG